MIQVKQITKSVHTLNGDLHILRPISLQIMLGESIAITGASGSGKSTLLGILAGLDTPSSGEVFFAEHCISAMDEEGRAAIRADNVGFIFQSFQLLPGLSALENVMLPMEPKGHKNAKQAAMNFLSRVGLLERAQHYPPQLSGGEQQRVAIARAFASQPLVLFADEPTGNLDSQTGQKIIDLLFELNRDQRTTLVFVTHEERLANLCQRRFRLDAGQILPSPIQQGESHVSLQTLAA
ncbi:MAG: ATP-binding cassette domain-containing protein [Burkholderiaceae bacterium]|nr:MAG: ATP-binding cassette domain-containing protein [Burkholderiaceae bacterium]